MPEGAPVVTDPLPAGLSSTEAAERLRTLGPNAVAPMRPRGIGALLRKFWGLVPAMLELAVLLELVLRRWVEALVIAALLIFNALLGYVQEGRAQQALALLRQHLTVTARVRRDGSWQVCPAAELVPGDVVHLRLGDVVPADVELRDGLLEVDQSQLTGESLPVQRGPGSLAYAGALVTRGEASGVVSATGGRTYFGRTAELVRTAEAPRRLDLLILGLTRYLAGLVILLALAVVAALVARGLPLVEELPFVLMLLVASVPIALPAMFTMSAALGARGLAQNGILVTRLSAIQDAAAMDVLCLDKTGTLTENRLGVGSVVPTGTTTPEALLRLAALASDEATQDPLDLAILRAAQERGIDVDPSSRVAFVPFDPAVKRSEATVRQDGQLIRVVKGAPAVVAELARTPWPDAEAQAGRLAADGSRVLAVASGTDGQLAFAGLIALGDPVRADSAALVEALQRRGVRVVLVTGDGEATARAVAAMVGIGGPIAPAGTLQTGVNPAALEACGVFAEVLPQDKFVLVEALQRAGHVVGMTGDGVNDAPALRQADVGIAVASATDVAKAAASLVLTRPGLGEIVAAIEGSRRIYQRMLAFVLTMTTRKIAIPVFLSLGVVLFGALVLNPLLMVLLMFATDVATMSLSTDRVLPSPVPDRWAVRTLVTTSLGLATLLVLLSGVVYWAAADVLALGSAATQTVIFVWMIFAVTQAVLYLTRARGFFWQPPYPGRWVVLSTVVDIGLVTLLATEGWLMDPISPVLVGGILVLALGFLVGADLLKVALLKADLRASAGAGSREAG
jgi:H+-transporting ATPase